MPEPRLIDDVMSMLLLVLVWLLVACIQVGMNWQLSLIAGTCLAIVFYRRIMQ